MQPMHWSQHWREIEDIRDACADPTLFRGGDQRVRDAIRWAVEHDRVVLNGLIDAAVKSFSEGGHRPARDINNAVEIALDHYLEATGRAAA